MNPVQANPFCSMRSAAAAAVLLAVVSSPASAQSAVTVYGIADVSLRYDRVAGNSLTALSSGLSRGSRLGFVANEDLGGGLRALAVLEMGLSLDDGLMLGNGLASPGFGRQAFVGVGSAAAGLVALGRQYTPIFSLGAGALDPFGANYLGTINTSFGSQGGLTSRASNAISYSHGYATALDAPTPRDRFSVAVLYAPGEAADGSRAGDQLSGAVGYGQDRWFVGYGAFRLRGSASSAPPSTSPRQTSQVLGGTYRFDFAMLFAALHKTANDAANAARINRANWSVGARIPMPSGQFILQYQHSNDRTTANRDFSNASVAYEYPLSKRTIGYANYGRNINRGSAVTPLYMGTLAVPAGADPSAFAIGMRQSF